MSAASHADGSAPGWVASPSVPRLRWVACGLLFVATALSFLDRQVLSVLEREICVQLGMDAVAYSNVNSAFLASYAVMFLLGGLLMDVVGTRMGLALSVGLWSLASAAHATARGALQLGLFRFVLGIGEGGCFPGVAKGVAGWFAPRERALAMGVAIGGASLGGALAPPLTVWLSEVAGWRGVFLVTGFVGALWVVAWWRLTRPASGGSGAPAAGGAVEPMGRRVARVFGQVGGLLARGDVWGLAAVRFIVDPVFYFYMFWIPKYLADERGISKGEIGALSWIPFLALGISNVVGGWCSDLIVRRGAGASVARKSIMACAALLTVVSSFVGGVGHLGVALAFMALLMFAHGFWVTNYVTLIGDRFPRESVGTVMGISGAIGAVGGIFANTAIGIVVGRLGFAPVWVASGLMYPLAFLVLLATTPARRAPAGG